MAAAERAGTLDEKGKVELAKRRKEMKLLQNKDFTCRDPRQGYFAKHGRRAPLRWQRHARAVIHDPAPPSQETNGTRSGWAGGLPSIRPSSGI